LIISACSEQSIVPTSTEISTDAKITVVDGILAFPSSESFQENGNNPGFSSGLYDFEALDKADNNNDQLSRYIHKDKITKEVISADRPITISAKLASMLNKDGMVIIGDEVIRLTRDFVFKTDKSRVESLKDLDKLSEIALNFINTSQKVSSNGSLRQVQDNIEIAPVMRSISEEPCDQIGGELGDPCNNGDGPGGGGPGGGGPGNTQNNYVDIANTLYQTENHYYEYHHERRLHFRTEVELNYIGLTVNSFTFNDRRRNHILGARWDNEDANLMNAGIYKLLLKRFRIPMTWQPYDLTNSPEFTNHYSAYSISSIQSSAVIGIHSLLVPMSIVLDPIYDYKTEDIQSIHFLYEERGNDTFRFIRRTQLQRLDYSYAINP